MSNDRGELPRNSPKGIYDPLTTTDVGEQVATSPRRVCEAILPKVVILDLEAVTPVGFHCSQARITLIGAVDLEAVPGFIFRLAETGCPRIGILDLEAPESLTLKWSQAGFA
jgi:hypothetical protein